MRAFLIAVWIMALGSTAAFAGAVDLDCRSVYNCLSVTGCDARDNDILHVREPEAGKPVFYYTQDAVFQATIERNGTLVTLWATGAGGRATLGTSLQTLVLTDGPEAIYSIASYVEGLGFIWSRNQLICEKVGA